MKNIHTQYPEIPPGIWLQSTVTTESRDAPTMAQSASEKFLRKMITEVYRCRAPQILREPGGKPYAKTETGELISVSVAHTKGVLVTTCATGYRLGVDVEHAQRNVSEALLKRMWHPDEDQKTLQNLGAIRIWTAKEAVLKAMGTGLRYPMRKVCLLQNERGWQALTENENFKVFFFQEQAFLISLAIAKIV